MIIHDNKYDANKMVNFGKMPNIYLQFLEHSLLNPIEYALLSLLWSSKSSYKPMQSTLAKRLGVSRVHINRSFKRLSELELIKVVKTDGKRENGYVLTIPADCVPSDSKFEIKWKNYTPDFRVGFVASTVIYLDEVGYLDR